MIPIRDNLSCKSTAYATYTIMAINVVVFFLEVFLGSDFVYSLALVPADVTAAFQSGSAIAISMIMLKFITATFLHGGLGHIFGNMIFLQAFGRAVENRYGSRNFVFMYLAGGIIAWIFHFMVDPTSTIPALGASGAIAAVLGAYLLFYPKAKFFTIFFIQGIPIPIKIYAFFFLPIWFWLQLAPGLESLMGGEGDGIAYWAHIGGFVSGFCMASLWAFIRPQTAECYEPINCDCAEEDRKRFGFHWKAILGTNHKPDCGQPKPDNKAVDTNAHHSHTSEPNKENKPGCNGGNCATCQCPNKDKPGGCNH